ncbi:MAG: hypothetical protein QG583_409 [Patescibacteria group bacterium]|nr:hypothetical protein [Patescibacteria group bacterium]
MKKMNSRGDEIQRIVPPISVLTYNIMQEVETVLSKHWTNTQQSSNSEVSREYAEDATVLNMELGLIEDSIQRLAAESKFRRVDHPKNHKEFGWGKLTDIKKNGESLRILVEHYPIESVCSYARNQKGVSIVASNTPWVKELHSLPEGANVVLNEGQFIIERIYTDAEAHEIIFSNHSMS